MILSNGELRIEISALGAELMSVYDLHNDTELLFNGDPKYWKRRSPVLFPNVGKTFENKMLIDGVTYATSQHGFARDREFVLESSTESSAVYLLKSDAATLERYPFDFELRIGYELHGRSMKVIWNVTNTSGKEMPFTIGGHPAFCFAHPTDAKEEYCLLLPGMDKLDCVLLDLASGTATPDNKVEIPLTGGVLPLTEELFARDALVLDDGQVKEVWLCRKDGEKRVGMKCEGFPNFGIWSVSGAPFVCLEPWMGRCDNFGFASELREKPNVNLLAPGKVFEVSYDVLLP